MAKAKGSTIVKSLEGKTVAITGANSGIGFETAKDLSSRGAKILMLCRSYDRTKTAMAELTDHSQGKALVEFVELDLTSLRSVRKCAEGLLQEEEKIDILINNAGVMLCPKGKTEDGYDLQLGVNHLGHFLLIELLLPLLKKSAASGFHPRIVIVSSLAHQSGQIYWEDVNFEKNFSSRKAYAQSKLANVMHGIELARRLDGTGISVYSLHPGVVNTKLFRHFGFEWFGKMIMPILKPFMITPFQGAQTTLYCALEDSIESQSGCYYSQCREKRPSRKALVEADQKRLWELSERFVGIK